MYDRKVKGFPVVDPAGRPSGIVVPSSPGPYF
jgi:hypothetical protein